MEREREIKGGKKGKEKERKHIPRDLGFKMRDEVG